ncbi:MAG: hypothetical protein IJS67_03880 [Clostridia bacterium]|nr:hypothetical protein [Clostridia bacterium]
MKGETEKAKKKYILPAFKFVQLRRERDILTESTGWEEAEYIDEDYAFGSDDPFGG